MIHLHLSIHDEFYGYLGNLYAYSSILKFEMPCFGGLNLDAVQEF